MYAHRVKVFNGAYDDAVVVLIPNNFHLELFPADQGLIDQQFIGGRQVKTPGTDLLELIPIVGNTATGPAHGERGPDNAGETDGIEYLVGLLHTVGRGGARCFQANAFHCLIEQLAVFRHVDRFLGCPDHLYAMLFQDAFTGQVQGTVEGGLAAHGGQQYIGFFNLDNARHRLPFDRLDVRGVRHRRIGHYGCRIGVHQDDPVTLLPQGLAGLGSGIIKFTGLADDDWSGTKDQDAFYVSTLRHGGLLFLGPCGNQVNKMVKQWRGIVGPRARFRVALETESVLICTMDAL